MAEILRITKWEATKLLKQNDLNRPTSERTVQRYAKLMRDGRWTLSCDAIGIDRNKQLINGQHRLRAVIESDTAQMFMVIHNLDRKAFEVADTGKRRSAMDVLAIDGRKHTATLAAVSKMIYPYLNENGEVSMRVLRGDTENVEVVNLVRQYPRLEEIAGKATQLVHISQPKKLLEPRLIAFVLALYGARFTNTPYWLTTLLTGIGLEGDNPLYVYRNRLLSDVHSGQKSHSMNQVGERLALLITVLNDCVSGTRRNGLPGWQRKTPMPQPVGITAELVKASLEPQKAEADESLEAAA
jgi:hypothetical protein